MKEQNSLLRPDYLFEVSWEVCNKAGGIHTVLMSKAQLQEQQLGINYIMIGPEIHKETDENFIFTEDSNLYSQWVIAAREHGLYFRIGRWNIPGSPVTILVDFSQYFTQKDIIFSRLWESFKLDSITGGWDYTEPALFGYAAAVLIESFYQHNISAYDKFVVHFHEWKTGAGLLHLKKEMEQAALVFTSHDTLPGRIIAEEGHDPRLENKVNIDELLDKTGQKAKYSLEKLSIVNADCFTTVSSLCSNEAEKFYNKPACVVTPNGLNKNLIPNLDQLEEHKQTCRNQLKGFVSKFFGVKVFDDAVFILHSGRYEFHNKGTDVFIDALSSLNSEITNKQIFALMSIPANHSGPIELIRQRIQSGTTDLPLENVFVTHHLLSYDNDVIINSLRNSKLNNKTGDPVKIIFIPAWLDGNDGIVNMKYIDAVAGIDMGVFPSFYEPWGYTPVECLMFGNPAATSSLSGFGVWALEHQPDSSALRVISRHENDQSNVISEIKQFILDYAERDTNSNKSILLDSGIITKAVLWDNFIKDYQYSYHKALELSASRIEKYRHKQVLQTYIKPRANSPHWYKVLIQPYFPENLLPLKELSQNLWWSWNSDAIELFMNIHPQLWEKSGNNPIALLEMLDIKQIRQLEKDEHFLSQMKGVHNTFREYMSVTPNSDNSIVYFCMEYGLHTSVKLYSGGLGILAGDYLKEASDMNANFTAVGLLYRYGYFNQLISPFGDQINEKIPQKFTHLPIVPVRDNDDNWIHVSLAFPGRTVYAKVWKMKVGRISLYLLDTDIDENSDYDRSITHQLYGGDWENRLKQELLLGIGGIRMLRKIGLKPDIYHLNEGHAAFLNLERMRFLIQEEKLNFNQAIEVLRASSLFTTHTPVPAGHDAFDESILRVYLSHYPQRFNISWEKFIGLGRFNENDASEKFSMSVLALKLSQECNGVSKLHGKVSREMFTSLYPGFFSEEIHISHVTNGVHYSTWTAPDWQKLLTGNEDIKLDFCLDDQSQWEHFHSVPDEIIWKIRNKYRNILTDFMSEKIAKDYTARQEQPHIILKTLENINPNYLTIGFARRFATYKRAHLLFSNMERLDKIVNNKDKPVRFIFSGKAHPHDGMGQELIKKIIQWSKLPEFVGKIIFLDNYDAEIAKKMVQGVDIWLNTPTRPLEASGTSGQKCVMNGVLHFSVLDGWWAEGYVPNAGWALKEARTYSDQKLQDELDSETIYSMLENDIIPLFYKRNPNDTPCEWVQIIKKNLFAIAPLFTTRRMMKDYFSMFYNPMFVRSKEVNAKNYEKAGMIASWKRKTEVMWQNVRIIENHCHDSNIKPLLLGEDFHAELLIDTGGINVSEIGVELLFGQKIMDKIDTILFSEDLDLKEVKNNTALFSKSIEIRRAGVLDFAIRIYIKHPDLPHRTDFGLVKWA